MHYRVSVYNYFQDRFREHGWQFSVLANELQAENQHEVRFPFAETPFQFNKYRRLIRDADPDVVILFLHLKDRILWPLIHWLKLRSTPVAVWTKTHNLDDPDNLLSNACFRYVHHLSDALILYEEGLVRFVAERQRHKVFVANNTINFTDFPAVEESKTDIKKAFDIPFRKVVLFTGRIAEEGNRKKVDHLIDIFRSLNRDDYGLVIVGSGLTTALRQRMNPANTRYLGEVHDRYNINISRVFRMADVCSIPGHVGLGLNQAFFFGLPVVTEEGHQPPEIAYLVNGRNGFVVAENDVEALRERLLYLLDNDEVRARMASNAKRDILQKASIEGMFQGFLSCADYLMKGVAEDCMPAPDCRAE
jgi:glycosyltransferase involved in cell wall biosynthesis